MMEFHRCGQVLEKTNFAAQTVSSLHRNDQINDVNPFTGIAVF